MRERRREHDTHIEKKTPRDSVTQGETQTERHTQKDAHTTTRRERGIHT